MQQTNKYQLNLIESGDTFSPDPLNENMEKVEAALEAVDTALDEKVAEAMSAMGTGGHNARIAFGSYTGNGNYGSSKPNSLTFDFHPVMVFIANNNAGSSDSEGIFFTRSSKQSSYIANVGGNCIATWSDYGLSWYGSSSSTSGYTVKFQQNVSGVTYSYVAIGYSD